VRVSRVRAFGPASLSADTTPRTIRYRVQPGEEVKVEIRTRGPAHTGEYGEDWVVRDAYGKPVAMVGGATLQIRFQVLPPAVPACGPGQVVADLLGESHPLPNTRVGPGEPLPVSWTLFNRGTCAWDSAVSLRFRQASGSRMSDPSLSTLPLGEAVPPTEAHTFHVPMRAPRADGSYREEWELVGPGGQVVRVSDGDGVDVRVVVSRTDEARAAEPECAPGEEVVAFMRSETVRDGSSIAPGAHVAKEWTLQNAGPCTWPAGALRLAPVASPAWVPARPLPRPVSDRPVPPKGTYTFRAPFTAPAAPGYYRVHWRMYNRAGAAVMMSQTFTIWADFHVRGPQP
jgi:methionine-rich copper-binding protein CopC